MRQACTQAGPVIEGEKWSATKWIHVSAFEKPHPTNDKCINENEKCEEWAAYNECKRILRTWLVQKIGPGACRKTCKVC